MKVFMEARGVGSPQVWTYIGSCEPSPTLTWVLRSKVQNKMQKTKHIAEQKQLNYSRS